MSQPGLIYKKIPAIMKAVGAITKDRSNQAQGYKFRGIEDMYNAFHSVFAEQGVFCAPEVIDSKCSEIEGENAQGKPKISYRTLLRVCHRFYAEDGSCVEVTTLGEGIDTSDKASNKAMSAAMKYAFIELFSVPTEDIDDSDRTSPEAGRTKGRHEQPGPEDGVTPTDYRISFGKWNGRSIEQVYRENGQDPIWDYIDYIKDSAKKKNQPLTGPAAEFVVRATEFLKVMTGAMPL